jgi:hypothetical protein
MALMLDINSHGIKSVNVVRYTKKKATYLQALINEMQSLRGSIKGTSNHLVVKSLNLISYRKHLF